jgi:hypothetical protein
LIGVNSKAGETRSSGEEADGTGEEAASVSITTGEAAVSLPTGVGFKAGGVGTTWQAKISSQTPRMEINFLFITLAGFTRKLNL